MPGSLKPLPGNPFQKPRDRSAFASALRNGGTASLRTVALGEPGVLLQGSGPILVPGNTRVQRGQLGVLLHEGEDIPPGEERIPGMLQSVFEDR